MRLYFYVVAIVIALSALSQESSSIRGIISDGVSGETMPFATVQIEGTTIGAVTDLDGNYSISVQPGTYNLIISFVGFESKKIENVVVTNGKVLHMDVKLEPEETTLESVVITAKRLVDTEGAVVEEVKQAEQVVNAVSSEEISKTEASNAGDVVSRIPGITLIDGKFIIVRGLNQRFNNVKLNGAPMPSTDPSTRAFSFDIIPSGIIESVFVYKSFTPSMTGEVAGAVININTKNFVDEDYSRVGFKFGYRVGATGQELSSDPSRGAGDIFTFGKGARKWGDEVANGVVDSRINPTLNRQQALSFDNTDFFGKSFTAVPDFGFSYGLGRLFSIKEKELSFSGALNLSNNTKRVEYERARYSIFGNNFAPANYTESSLDVGTTRSAKLMGMANFSLEVSESLELRFQNLYNRIGSSSVINRDVINNDQNQNRLVENIDYLDEILLASQLGATWHINDFQDQLNTVIGYARSTYDQPNRRATYRISSLSGDEPFNFLLPDLGAALIGTTRFSSLMNENSVSLTSDYVHNFGDAGDEEQSIKLEFGIFGEYRSRDFSARNIGYGSASISNNPAAFVGSGLQKDEVFSEENFFVSDGTQRGIVIDEKTQSVDTYSASSSTAAAYLSFLIPVQNWTFNIGGRFESNTQNITGAETQSEPYGSLNRDLLNTNFLPFINASFRLNSKWQARGAYSQTVNRPELRELAPFAYFDFSNAYSAKGNPLLKQSTISSYDFRLEFYPKAGELISLATFSKDFKNPIEVVNISVNDEFQPVNNRSALVYGVELEVRKNLDFISTGGIIGNTSFLLNAALVHSETKLVRSNAIAVNQNRPLGGQSPYVINSGLYYSDPKTGWAVNINYNTYGKRIVIVEADTDRPPIYELPRQLIDLSVSKKMKNGWETKLAASNILNAQFRLFIDGNFDEKIDIDESLITQQQTSPLYQRYREGQVIELSFSKRF